MTANAAERPRRLGYFSGKLAPLLLPYLLYSYTITQFEMRYLAEDLTVSQDFQAVASLFLGSLLAIRMNTAHAKWMEARLQFGRLVSVTRVLATYLRALPLVPEGEKREMFDLLIAYPRVMMDHLRIPASPHPLAGMTATYQRRIVSWREQGWIDSWAWSSLARLGEDPLMICGACERIRNSPLVRSYHIMVMVCITLYLAAAPLMLHNRIWTIPVVMMLALFFFTLELLASDVDEPFGQAPDDLPLESLCASVKATVEQIVSSGDTSTIPSG